MIDHKATHPSRHHRFRQKMAEAGFRLASVVPSNRGQVPPFEINFWIGVNGKVFITQVWEGGGYDVYYQTDLHQIDECEAEAVRFGTDKETPARELYAALRDLVDNPHTPYPDIGRPPALVKAHAVLAKHLGLSSQNGHAAAAGWALP